MFSLNDFVMKTVKGMIGNYPDFQAMEYALNWYTKGVLTESNLAEIEALIEEKNYPKELKIEESADDIGELELKVIKPESKPEPEAENTEPDEAEGVN